MAFKAANPVTLGKKRKKILFLCRSYPLEKSSCSGCFVSHQRGTKTSPRLFLLPVALLLVLFLQFSSPWFYFLFFAFFFKQQKQTHFFGHSSPFVWSSPNPLVSKFFIFFRLSTNASSPSTGLTWISLWQLPCILQDEFREVIGVTGHTLTPASWLWGLTACVSVSNLHLTRLEQFYSWCMQLHIVIILTEHTNNLYKLYILDLGVWSLCSPMGNFFLPDVEFVHLNLVDDLDDTISKAQLVTRTENQTWVYHVPRLMYIVDWNEILWIFVFGEGL